ncbi:MAG TPA: hypothetical protein VMV18_14080 [bacterium]|nr:hypothetical protein [bacterium]
MILATGTALPSVIAVACGGGSSHPSPPPAGYTGEVRLERYHTYLPAAPVSPFLFAQIDFQAPPPSNQYLQAGAALTLTGPAGSIRLTEHNAFGKLVYQPDQNLGDLPLSLWVPDSDYTAQGTGSGANGGVPAFDFAPALHTPGPLEILSPDVGPGQIAVNASSDLELSWTAGDGDYIFVIFAVASGGSGSYLEYRVADDGSFPVPQSGLATLPVGVGSLTMERVIERPLTLPDGGTGTGYGGDAITVRLVRE